MCIRDSSKIGQLPDNTLLHQAEKYDHPSRQLIPASAPLASDEDGDSSVSINQDLSSSTFTSQQAIPNDQNFADEDFLQNVKSHDEASLLETGTKTPILRKIGEKTPPGTLKKRQNSVTDGNQPSAKSWCNQYSQAFLSKTIDTQAPIIDNNDSTNIDNGVPQLDEETKQLVDTTTDVDNPLPHSDKIDDCRT